MAYRKAMSKRESKRNFRKGGKVKAKNFALIRRGGFRL